LSTSYPELQERKKIVTVAKNNRFILLAANDRACCCAGIYFRSAHNVSPIEKLKMKICAKVEQ
jgi:hypothetical protein